MIKPEIKAVINYALAFVSGAAGGAMEAFNIKLADTDKDDFTINLANHLPLEGLARNDGEILLNMSRTKAPEFNNALGEILLHFSGLFVEKDYGQVLSQSMT